MMSGFQKIVEERIQHAQRKGDFDRLPGTGKPLPPSDDPSVPQELRLAYKILKNADCVPPEIEMKREIHQLEDLLSRTEETGEKYKLIKKLNFLIMKLNMTRGTSIAFEVPQRYEEKLIDCLDRSSVSGNAEKPHTGKD